MALRPAARHPERVSSLVPTAPFARADAQVRLTARVWRELVEAGRRELAEAGDPGRLDRFLLAHCLSPAALAALDPAALEAAAEETGAGVPAGTAEQVEPVERLGVTADPARITAPTLMVSTAGDALIPPRLHRAVTAGTPGARPAEPPGGHLPFAEHPGPVGGAAGERGRVDPSHTRSDRGCVLLPTGSIIVATCWYVNLGCEETVPRRSLYGAVAMGHYKSNLRDIEFNLFEVLGRDKVYGTGPFEEMDVDTAKSVLEELTRLSENELAESFADADRNPPVFDPETNTAPVPASFKKSYQAFMDSEYWRLGLPEEIGGTTSPRSLIWAYAELILGANPAVWMYSSGPAFAGILFEEGNEVQKHIAKIAVEKQWGSTMVLTEPDAGSDVGAGRTKAVQQEDGSWHIEGVKRFITSGEHDMSENILHYVLARPEGAGPGTKGLSLFLVPKYEFDFETGELGERNGVYATNVEHKMGLKASNTCEMTFGDQHPAKGWLIGDKHDGIRQMFRIIEFARMMVGTKAISTLSTGYLNALEYAKERVQGPDLAQFMDKTAPKVTITHHPDVRRSLITQKAYAEGMRALVLYTASIQDAIQVKEANGEDASAEHALNDLLLPIVKGYGSEKGYEQLAQSLQTFGGSGFLQEYPIEQYIRDSKIDTLYEGTTAIQGQDFFFRKIVRNQGAALNALAEDIKKFLALGTGGEELAGAREHLAKAAVELEAIVGLMLTDLAATEQDTKNIYKVGLNTTRLLMASGDVVVGYLLLKGAAIAAEKLATASAKDQAFYTGKIAAAKFFAANVLPGVTLARKVAGNVELDLMELDEAAF